MMAWSDAAREAAALARKQNAKGHIENRSALKVFAAARHESRKGYVQHVQWNSQGKLGRSDWYEHGKTLASYENGRTLHSDAMMNTILRGKR